MGRKKNIINSKERMGDTNPAKEETCKTEKCMQK